MRTLVATCCTILFSCVAAYSQSASQTVQVGYAVVTPSSPTATGLVFYETIVQTRSQDTLEVGIFPPNFTVNALMPVEVSASLSKNLGIAIANPNNATANVTMVLNRSDGTPFTTGTTTVPAHGQISKLITELFPAPVSGGFSTQAPLPAEFTGTLAITAPNGISIVGLKFRGLNSSAIPVTDVSLTPILLPMISFGVGGLGAALFPQFVTGGGWATQIGIANANSSSVTVRLDLFTQNGSPLVVALNGQASSSFTNLVVPGNGLLTLAPSLVVPVSGFGPLVPSSTQ